MIFMLHCNLSRGVLPENLKRGPYAVVDELVLNLSTTEVKFHEFGYFLDHSIYEVKSHGFGYFFGP